MNAKKIATAGMLSAIIIVLQLISTFVKFGPVNITLALVPIIIGASLYGKNMGAMLGTVLGLFILIAGIFGWDGGFILLMADYHPVLIAVTAVFKTTVAGYAAGAVYEFFHKRKKELPAVVLAGAVCPIVNTGLFLSVMLIFFRTAMVETLGAGGNILSFAIISLAGINFIVEFAVNMLLAATIVRLIPVIKKIH